MDSAPDCASSSAPEEPAWQQLGADVGFRTNPVFNIAFHWRAEWLPDVIYLKAKRHNSIRSKTTRQRSSAFPFVALHPLTRLPAEKCARGHKIE
jgi:hypothetical protein